MSVVEMKVTVIGESINELTLSQWLKPDGSFVKIDEPICEFESDKATLEFPAEAEGKLIHVAKEGDDLTIGAVVAKIDTSVKSNGESAPADTGTPKEEETKVKPKEKTEQKEEQKRATKIAEEKPENSIKKPQQLSGHPSPAAAKILRESSVNPSSVSGSGKEGRITKDDAVKASAKKSEEPITENKTSTPSKPASQPSEETPKQPAATHIPFQREERREKMSRMRRTIARRLVSAKNNTAMLTTFNEVDMSGIMELRKKYQDQFVAKYGIKLGFMSIFAKACAQVLMEKPEVNAHIDGDDLIFHRSEEHTSEL